MIWLTLQSLVLIGALIQFSRHLLSVLLMIELIFLSLMLRQALQGWLTDDRLGLVMAMVILVMAGIESALLLSQLLLYHRHHGFPQIQMVVTTLHS